MIVITLTKVPQSLRGDLTKWCQEIQTGVYVGRFSARIRDSLWDRILDNVGSGEATMVYTTNNELGYQYKTTRKDKEVVDFDGIPLMKHLVDSTPIKQGFSKAAKYHRAKLANRTKSKIEFKDFVAIDIETTGLDPVEDRIISIGAIKRTKDREFVKFYRIVNAAVEIPTEITKLTGLSSRDLKEKGISIDLALKNFLGFIKESPIVGYNLPFDISFIFNELKRLSQEPFSNEQKDLFPIIKKKNRFLANNKLSTILKEYEIKNDDPHNALGDAIATYKLAEKLIALGFLKI
ncbi:type I-E CRISPR-associated endoribonuclease Cas2e [Lactobacillus agrestimuris]|uniref:type I-E CRISPR-associated endoribonuclease Cas2e n=1 Tax=Lactobacillus agrestimuris TaxID=2941328 RepID=UPI002042D968|nr:type I-E CRISPR-associated endoribonuclease Cas2e [Lactobacillus agrestimuris]